MDRPIIVAVDFDGILCKNEFPEIGRPNYEMISFIMRLQDSGIETILWTSRVDEKLADAIKWCEDRGLHFTSINDNTPNNQEEYGTNPRKVYADIYMDDRSPYMLYKSSITDIKTMIEQTSHIIRRSLGGKLV